MPKNPKPPKSDDPAERPPMAVKIAQLRKKKEWGQQELADKLGTHLSNVARIELGKYKPSVEVIEAMMELFGVTADELIRPDRHSTPVQHEADALREDYLSIDPEYRPLVHRLMTTCKANPGQLVIMKLYLSPKIDKDDDSK